ncbi:MAG TPA: FAD-dependent thymidylate synthase [Acidimicrobiia bacterium]|nr:FAD-dependent thymidylate synthase [Acidimicrobiia bacterium]
MYAQETFTDEEITTLRPYFTNLEGPVFALTNLPEVVRGALFARYSRSDKSLRRLFLDEFVGDLDVSGDTTVDATVGLKKAETLYQRVFLEYGDDSVAQLGGVHLACEQASNVLTKVLEWGRLMAYLEQSTRYIAYDTRLGGRYRYIRPSDILDSPLGARYVGDIDSIFDGYSALIPRMLEWAKQRYPKDPSDSDFVYKQTIKAKALDSLRGLLPAATLSNVGMYGTGQSYEALLLRMRAHPLPEMREYAHLMLIELRKVIPSFLERVDRPDRGGEWIRYFSETREDTDEQMERIFGEETLTAQNEPASVQLTDFDPDGEDKVIAAILYSRSHKSEEQLRDDVAKMSVEDKTEILLAYVGDRTNRRHKPGRAFERTDYRFDILSDYGAFRDLQRHRMLTIEWQQLTPYHGYDIPESITEAGASQEFEDILDTSKNLFDVLAQRFPVGASYAVALQYKIRYVMQMNVREAMHLTELRSAPAGHPSYRKVAQDMHTLIRDVAGHKALAQAMKYVDYEVYELERLKAERAAEKKRAAVTSP